MQYIWKKDSDRFSIKFTERIDFKNHNGLKSDLSIVLKTNEATTNFINNASITLNYEFLGN